MNSMVGMHNTC